jgi:hypothetical protein
MTEKQHICDINIRVHLEQEQWDYTLIGDVEVSYADARFFKYGVASQDVGSYTGMTAEDLKSHLNDRLIGMLVRLGATMRKDFMETKIK